MRLEEGCRSGGRFAAFARIGVGRNGWRILWLAAGRGRRRLEEATTPRGWCRPTMLRMGGG